MLGENPSWDVSLGLASANLIAAMYGNDPARDSANLVNPSFNGQFTTMTYSEHNVVLPRIFTALSPAWGIIAIGGTENVAQGVDLCNAYFPSGVGDNPPFTVNAFANLCALAFLQRTEVIAAFARPNVLIIGHSLGGTIGVALAYIRLLQTQVGLVKVITFGAPKPGTDGMEPALRGARIGRWMCDDDPVPLVLPTFPQAPAAMFFYPIPNLRRLGEITQCKGGLQIDDNFVVTDQIAPQRAVVRATTSLGAWLYSLISGAGSSHNIAEYQRRFRGAVFIEQRAAANAIQRAAIQAAVAEMPVALQDINLPAGIQGAAAQVGVTERAITLRREVEAYRQSLIAKGVSATNSSSVIPPQLIFSRKKVGRMWFTTFGGVPFALGPRRKKAGGLANAGNLFIRRLLRERAVDADVLGQRWLDFLAAAQDPASGIEPTLPPPDAGIIP